MLFICTNFDGNGNLLQLFTKKKKILLSGYQTIVYGFYFIRFYRKILIKRYIIIIYFLRHDF